VRDGPHPEIGLPPVFHRRPLRSRKRNRSGYANNIALTIGGEALRASGEGKQQALDFTETL
jgi:hypothetical protein